MQMKIGFLFNKSWLGFGNLDLIFKATVEHNCQIWAKNGLSTWYQYISQELMDGMLQNAWISLGKDKEFIMFDHMHNIFKVTTGHD